jgi:hypothetical protein
MDKKSEERIRTVLPMLNELQKRRYLAAEAQAIGWGGIGDVSRVTGVARNTISAGLKELKCSDMGDVGSEDMLPLEKVHQRQRRPGGGRKSIEEKQPGITESLLKLVSDHSFGNPENPLQWTTKSLRNLSEELQAQGYQISHMKVGQLLKENGFSLQVNQKMLQIGTPSPDRDEQFEHINETAKKYMHEGQPVVSVDCKKKENIGNFKNGGAEYCLEKHPVKTLDHDFPLPENGKAVPYGVYDMLHNEGYVNVGISADTAEFAVQSLRKWWQEMGIGQYPCAHKLYITADGGGSNGSRNRLWKTELQKFADETHLAIEVSHFPPGTSKWNKIEHRMFSQISKNWRGRPLVSLAVIISLIANTTTQTGLEIKCGLDSNNYRRGINVTDEELQAVNLIQNCFHGEWNYIINPHENT